MVRSSRRRRVEVDYALTRDRPTETKFERSCVEADELVLDVQVDPVAAEAGRTGHDMRSLVMSQTTSPCRLFASPFVVMVQSFDNDGRSGMEFMALVYSNPDGVGSALGGRAAAAYEGYMAVSQDAAAAGALVDASGLEATCRGDQRARPRRRGDRSPTARTPR